MRARVVDSMSSRSRWREGRGRRVRAMARAWGAAKKRKAWMVAKGLAAEVMEAERRRRARVRSAQSGGAKKVAKRAGWRRARRRRQRRSGPLAAE